MPDKTPIVANNLVGRPALVHSV